MATSKSIELRVYIDGIKVPASQASININPQKGTTATIKLPAHPKLEELGPRALVHIFYDDDVQKTSSNYNRFKLIFEGEIISSNYVNSERGRQISLSANGMSSYLRIASVMDAGYHQPLQLQTNSSNSKSGGEFWQSNVNEFLKEFYGVSQNNSSDGKNESEQIFTDLKSKWTNIVSRSDDVGDFVNGILDTISGFDDFFKISDERLKLSDRSVELPDELSVNLSSVISDKYLKQVLQSQFGGMKSKMPFLNLIQNIMSMFKHSINFSADTTETFKVQPMFNFVSPPSCNIILPKDFTSISYSHNYLKEATRAVVIKNTQRKESQLHVAPLIKMLESGAKSFQPKRQKSRGSDVVEEETTSDITGEEAIKGKIPTVKNYDHHKLSAAAGGDKSVREFMEKIAHEEWAVGQRNAGRCNVKMGFMPELKAGYTTFVIDPTFDVIFGTISSIKHTIAPGNNRANTRINVDLPQRTITNPRNLNRPQISPYYAKTYSENSVGKPGEDNNIEDYYQKMINGDLNYPDSKEIHTIPVKDKDDLFKNIDNENIKHNHVLSRAVVSMADTVKDGNIITDKFRQRAHMSIRNVFEEYYNAKPLDNSKSSKNNNYDAWDFYGGESNLIKFDHDKKDLIIERLRERQQTVRDYNQAIRNRSGSHHQENRFRNLFDTGDK